MTVYVKCKGKLFTFGILIDSKVISYMIDDCGDSDEPIPIPDKYYDVLMNMDVNDNLQILIDRLEFYNFLEITDLYIKKLCKHIGSMLELDDKDYDISYDLKLLLLEY